MEREEYFQLFRLADELAPHAQRRQNTDLLKDKTLLTAFYQPSTRTRLATEAAMHRLGGHVLGFSDAKMTRAGDFYQESIKDTVHMLEYDGDVRMRTMHSILYAMSQFDMQAYVVSPPDMSLLDDFKAELDLRNVVYRE